MLDVKNAFGLRSLFENKSCCSRERKKNDDEKIVKNNNKSTSTMMMMMMLMIVIMMINRVCSGIAPESNWIVHSLLRILTKKKINKINIHLILVKDTFLLIHHKYFYLNKISKWLLFQCKYFKLKPTSI